MKKILIVSAMALFGVIALSSCRKNYECVSSTGEVLNVCNSCKSRGVIKSAFDLDCTFEGGTVQVQ